MRTTLQLFIIVFLTVSSVSFLYSQTGCGNHPDGGIPKNTSCTENSAVYNSFYSKKESYIPRENSNEDFIKTIHVSFHIWQRENGSGTIDDTPFNRERLRDSIINKYLNRHYKDTWPRGVPLPYPTEYIDDTKFRVVLDSIYFYRDKTPDSIYFYCNDYYKHNQRLDTFLLNNHPERMNSIRLYFTRGYYSDAWGFSHHGSVLTFAPNDVDMNVDSGADYAYSYHLFHEIGHGLDLWHTYDKSSSYEQNCNSNYVDFLWDVYDTTQVIPCPTDSSCDICIIEDDHQTNNLMSAGAGRFTSALQMGIMRRATVLENFYNTEYYIRDYITGYNPIPFEITEDETWDFSIKMYQDLVVESGAVLTIQCDVQFVPEAKIIIKPGGKLILDGGKLTNERYYKDFWQGIQVYGTTNKNQFPESNPTYQGLLVVKNGGIIENAHFGVVNWKNDDYNSIGGVIQSTGGIFRNNRKDVAFMPYQNYNSSGSNTENYRDLSYFRDTEFITDDDFIEKDLAIQTHVTMWDVDGITFTNCHFSNEITTDKDNSSAPNRGIYSIDAGYKVRPGCSTIPPIGQSCPTADLLKSSFSGLETAIEPTSSASTKPVVIQQSDFDDNALGITVYSLDNVSINRNTINVGDGGYSVYGGLGVGIFDATGFLVEENEAETELTDDNYFGFVVNSSGANNNRIYKNKASELDYGMLAIGKNSGTSSGGIGFSKRGLKFLCNSLEENEFGIAAVPLSSNDGIHNIQGELDGTQKVSAGNTFQNNDLDFYNDVYSITYHHNQGNTEPTTGGSKTTTKVIADKSHDCISSFGGLIAFKPSSLALDSLNMELTDLAIAYNDLNFTLQSLIDDGNTEEFTDNIESNWSNDAWLLRAKLLETSPYLSSEALLEAANQNVLPNGMLLEVLLANPDATKGDKFIYELEVATQNSFPEYMLNYVKGNWDSRTLRTDMEEQLSSIDSELSNTISWIKHLTKLKEEYTDAEKFEVLKLGDGLYDKVGLIDYYIERSDFSKADSVLNAIENDKKYSEDLELIDNFGDYIHFRSSLGNRNLAQLDSTEISYLQTLAENNGRVAGYAQNILCFFYDICYEKDIVLGPPGFKSAGSENQNNIEDIINALYTIKIYPNPAADYSSIAFEIYDQLDGAEYKIHNLSGHEFLSGSIQENKGEIVLDTRSLQEGIYIVTFYNNGKLKVSKKLMINKK